MTAQRLRKTFQYPEDDDADVAEQGMDEQDRTTLISTLSTNDTASTTRYTLLLLLLPLVPIPLYLPLLVRRSSCLPSLFAIASLAASAYTLWYLRLSAQDGAVLGTTHDAGTCGQQTERRATGGIAGADKAYPPTHFTPRSSSRPVQMPRPPGFIPARVARLFARYLPAANLAGSGILALLEVVRGRHWSEGFAVGGGHVPLLICGVVLWARRELRMIDLRGLEELSGKVRGE